MIKIFIADDHALIREGIKKLVGGELGYAIVGEADNAAAVHRFFETGECDVLVLDISMPGKDGLELIKDLKAARPALHILIFTMHPEERFAIRALKAGASGYLTKMSAPELLLTAIRKVASGGKYISESLAEKLAFSLDAGHEKSGHELLSDREFEVFRLIAQGKSVAEIGKALSISPSTVNTYRGRIFEKMDLRSNAEIIRYALRHHLLE